MLTAPNRTTPLQHRLTAPLRWQGAGLALLLASASVLAQPAAKTATKPAASPQASAAKTSKVVKPATARQKLKNEASGLALASETAETIDELQLAIAARVLTGNIDCEFNQRISILPLAGKAGFFTITHFIAPHKSQRYTMAPRETATGAVRLEDKAAGVVWLQIPTKSMLMNARAGQRMVDSCLHAEQRVALAAAAAAGAAPGQGIGIVVQAPVAAPVVATPPAPVRATAASETALPALPSSTPPVPAPPTAAAADNTAAPALPPAISR